jgi:hypothetical protein
MVERLMILARGATSEDALARLQAAGGRVLAKYGDRVWVADLTSEAEAAIAGDADVRGVFAGAVPDPADVDDDAGRMGIAAWNLRQSSSFRAARGARQGDGRTWDDEGFEPEG